MDKKIWKVEFYGEGTSWVIENLTYEQASEKIDSCPKEYMGFVVPMEYD